MNRGMQQKARKRRLGWTRRAVAQSESFPIIYLMVCHRGNYLHGDRLDHRPLACGSSDERIAQAVSSTATSRSREAQAS